MYARAEPLLLLGWSMLTAALAFGGFSHPIRSFVPLVFLAFVPGLALLRVLRLTEPVMRVLLAVPLSLAVAAAVSGVLVYAGLPSWDLSLTILLSITVGAITIDLAWPAFGAAAKRAAGRSKMDDEERQSAVVQTLLAGGDISDAARVAGVSPTTLRRALERSEPLRRAAAVATREPPDGTTITQPRQRSRSAS